MRRHRLIAVVVSCSVLVLAGCATRGWVRDLVDQKSTEMGGRIAGVDSSVQRVDTATKAAAARAEDAAGRADAAATRADDVNARLTRLWANRSARDVMVTYQVQFARGSAALSDQAQTGLLELVRELKSNGSLSVNLEGYTDPVGPRDYNLRLSQRRVESVRRYLFQKGIDLARVHAIGLGPLPDPHISNVQKRRVTVNLMAGVE